MEGFITYLGFMAVVITFTKIIFRHPGSESVEVENPVESPGQIERSGQGYWDYLLVTGIGAIMLVVIFFTSI